MKKEKKPTLAKAPRHLRNPFSIADGAKLTDDVDTQPSPALEPGPRKNGQNHHNHKLRQILLKDVSREAA